MANGFGEVKLAEFDRTFQRYLHRRRTRLQRRPGDRPLWGGFFSRRRGRSRIIPRGRLGDPTWPARPARAGRRRPRCREWQSTPTQDRTVAPPPVRSRTRPEASGLRKAVREPIVLCSASVMPRRSAVAALTAPTVSEALSVITWRRRAPATRRRARREARRRARPPKQATAETSIRRISMRRRPKRRRSRCRTLAGRPSVRIAVAQTLIAASPTGAGGSRRSHEGDQPGAKAEKLPAVCAP